MCDPSNLKMEISVITQCLDFFRQMESNQKHFKLEVKLSNGFSFNFNNLNQEESKFRTRETKKKSPSTIRRNAARKQKFIEKKNMSSVDNEFPQSSFKCDQCDFEANCKVSLRKHTEKEHQVIPQLDGLNDIPQLDGHAEKIAADETVQPCNVEKHDVKERVKSPREIEHIERFGKIDYDFWCYDCDEEYGSRLGF